MPHCPVCSLESRPGRARCPLDRAFTVVSRCPSCQQEVFPRNRFCGGCGEALPPTRPTQGSVSQSAPARLRLAALLLDGFALFVLPLIVPECLVLLPFYFWFLEARGRQTVAQFMLRLAVLDAVGQPLGYRAAARRLGRYLLFPLMFWKGLAWFEQEGRLWRVPE